MSLRPTAKQRRCPHPSRKAIHVHPTFDDRYEICDLCHLIRVAPLPAPWMQLYDAAQESASAPDLFTTPAPT